jgi:hypothetical protein
MTLSGRFALRAGQTIVLAATNQQPPTNMKRNLIMLLLLALGISTFSSCVPLAAGAAVGYVAHEEGYRVRNPVTKH